MVVEVGEIPGVAGEVHVTVLVPQSVFSLPLAPDWNVAFNTAPLYNGREETMSQFSVPVGGVLNVCEPASAPSTYNRTTLAVVVTFTVPCTTVLVSLYVVLEGGMGLMVGQV